MRKRLPALFLALVLSLGLTVPAFAEEKNYPELYAWCPESFMLVRENLTYKARVVGEKGALGEAEDYGGDFAIIPNSENYLTGLGNLPEDGVNGILVAAYSDPDGDGVYDQRLFQYETEKREIEGVSVDAAVDVAVLPLPKDGAYKLADHITLAAYAALLPGFEQNEDGTAFGINAAELYELFGNNTQILFISQANQVIDAVLLCEGAFSDVPGIGWYSEHVSWAVDKGITNGSGDNEFAPGNDCTHIQILTFLARAAGITSAAAGSWAEEQKQVITWAMEKGMIGEDFDGSKPCTRAEAVNYIWQAFDKPSAAASDFKDMEGYEDYAKAVDWANEKGITRGSGNGMFEPGTVCSRAHIVTFLSRAYQ